MTNPAAIFDSAPNVNLGRLYYLVFTVPAGTPIASPFSAQWPLEDNYLIRIDARIPPGPSGSMGFRILWSQQQIVPWGNLSWLIANDESIPWESSTALTASALTVQGYNTGNFPHSVYLRALISTLPPAVQQNANEQSGSIALPASQVGALSAGVDTFTAPSGDITEQDIESQTQPESDLEPVIAISPSMSLVAAS